MVAPVMGFTFIHTADWQLGKAFSQFDPDLSVELRLARLNAIDTIAAHATEQGAAHVLVAGDVWDQEMPHDATLSKSLERLSQAKHVTWWLLPGNHDPAKPNGLWQHVFDVIGVPDNVKVLLTPEPVEISDGVFVLPAPLTSKDPGRDLTAWMNDAATPEGALRLGLAHGGTQQFGGEDGPSSMIDPARADVAQLDYLALGDWHGKLKVNDRAWYAGTPEPDRFRNNDPGWCLAVTLEAPGALPEVTPLGTGAYQWIAKDVALTPGTPVEEIFELPRDTAKTTQKTLLQLSLSGQLSLQDAEQLDKAIGQYRNALAYLDVRREALQIMVDVVDLDRLDHAGSLRVAAEALKAQAEDENGAPAERRLAHQALVLLFTMAGDDGARP